MINPPMWRCDGTAENVFPVILKNFRAMYVRPEQIIIGAGTEYLYSILIQLLGVEMSVMEWRIRAIQRLQKFYRSMGVSMSILIWMKRELLQRNWKKKKG